jgi:hypothetical protein
VRTRVALSLNAALALVVGVGLLSVTPFVQARGRSQPPAPARSAGPVSGGDGATVNESGREKEEDKRKRTERAGDLQGVVLHDVLDAEADRVFASELSARRQRALLSYTAPRHLPVASGDTPNDRP